MQRSKQITQNSAEDVEAKILKVKEMHRIGTLLLNAFSKHPQAGEMAKHAETHGIPAGAARRYRQFATLYEESDLEELYGMSRIQEFGLTTTHFRVLIGVKKKELRRKLTEKAIMQKLSISDLRHLAQKKKKPRSRPSEGKPSGRKPDILRFLEKDRKNKLFPERLQLDMAKWRALLGYLLDRIDDMDPRIATSLENLQASVENVDSVCKKVNSEQIRRK